MKWWQQCLSQTFPIASLGHLPQEPRNGHHLEFDHHSHDDDGDGDNDDNDADNCNGGDGDLMKSYNPLLHLQVWNLSSKLEHGATRDTR